MHVRQTCGEERVQERPILRCWRVAVAMALLCALVSMVPVRVAAAAVPILEEHGAVASPVPLGGTLTVYAHLVDPAGDILTDAYNQPRLYYGRIGGIPLTLVSGTLRDGIWQASTTIIPNVSMLGDYSLNEFTAADNAGNNTTQVFVVVPGMAPEFTVAGGTADTTAPVFQSFSVSASSIIIGQAITFTAHVTDPDDGVHSVSLSYNGPRGTWGPNGFSLVSGTPQDGIWQATGTNVPIGTYTVALAGASDTNLNVTQVGPSDPVVAGAGFTVVDQPDKTPPVFQSLSISGTSFSPGGTIVVTARITEDLSGVSTSPLQPSVTFMDSNGYGPSGDFSLISGTPLDGVWQARIAVPAQYYPDIYAAASLWAYDAVKNWVHIIPPYPPLNGVGITVIHATPTISAISTAGGPAGGGTSVTISGTNFTTGASVSFDGVPALNVDVVNTTTITAVTPAHATGVASHSVTDTDGLGGTLSNAYTFVAPNPATRPTTYSPSPSPAVAPTGRIVPSSGSGSPAPNVMPSARS